MSASQSRYEPADSSGMDADETVADIRDDRTVPVMNALGNDPPRVDQWSVRAVESLEALQAVIAAFNAVTREAGLPRKPVGWAFSALVLWMLGPDSVDYALDVASRVAQVWGN